MEVKDWVEVVLLGLTVAGILIRIGSTTKEFRMIAGQQAAQITEIKTGLDKLSGLVIELTKVSGRLDRLEDRQLQEGKRVDEISKRVWRQVAAD